MAGLRLQGCLSILCHHDGLGSPSIAVNLSPVQLRSPNLLTTVMSALASSSLPPERLELEITETVLLSDNKVTYGTLRDLKAMGIRIALDDFGTGYSSLLYLKRFPVGLLKIDQSFVADLGHDPDDETIAKAIVTLARALGVQAVAEGVETADQEKRLRKMGCECGQGYRYGRPLPIATVERQWFGAAQSIQTRS